METVDKLGVYKQSNQGVQLNMATTQLSRCSQQLNDRHTTEQMQPAAK